MSCEHEDIVAGEIEGIDVCARCDQEFIPEEYVWPPLGEDD